MFHINYTASVCVGQHSFLRGVNMSFKFYCLKISIAVLGNRMPWCVFDNMMHHCCIHEILNFIVRKISAHLIM